MTMQTFTGVQILVFGTIASNGTGITPESSYCIDGGPKTTYLGIQINQNLYRQLFFDSGTLSALQEHTIIIENLVDNGFFFLDFANISATSQLAPFSTSEPSTTATDSLLMTTTLDIASPTISQLTETHLVPRNVPVGIIFGSVVAGIFVIGLSITAIILQKRKRLTGSQGRIEQFTTARESTGSE